MRGKFQDGSSAAAVEHTRSRLEQWDAGFGTGCPLGRVEVTDDCLEVYSSFRVYT